MQRIKEMRAGSFGARQERVTEIANDAKVPPGAVLVDPKTELTDWRPAVPNWLAGGADTDAPAEENN